MRKLFLSLFIIYSAWSCGRAQITLSPIQKQQLEKIAAQDVPENAPGIATAIVQNGRIIFEQYAGLADLSDSSLIKSTTRFNIASNGKQFTALAILSLIDEKKLTLSDDIRKWFPKLLPEVKEAITVQHLLNHTSGIRDCYDLWSIQGYTWWEKSFNNGDVLRLLEQQRNLNFNPGTNYLYSNSNYILLAMLVEKVSNKSFVDFTNQMFQQLNMLNTSFVNDASSLSGQIAWSYFNFGTWTTYDWIWKVCGDGNLFSTLEDQIQWERLIQGKGETTFKRGLIAESQKAIKESNFKNYGYGLEFGEYKGLPYRFHEGATGAWKATVVRFPEKNISMITLTNTGKAIPFSQTRQMADVVFDLKSAEEYFKTEPQSTSEFVTEDEILGTYLTEGDFAFTFEKRDDKIFLKRVGRNDVELEREADNIFHQKFDPPFKQEFTKKANGQLQVTAYYTTHAPYSLTKVNDLPNAFNYGILNGTYFNEETNTEIVIKHKQGENYDVKFREGYITNGLLVSTDKMLVDFYSLEFKNGDILLNGDRVKKISYLKKQD